MKQIISTPTPVLSFSSETTMNLDTIKFPVRAGGITKIVDFSFTDQPTVYNAIISTRERAEYETQSRTSRRPATVYSSSRLFPAEPLNFFAINHRIAFTRLNYIIAFLLHSGSLSNFGLILTNSCTGFIVFVP